MLLAQRAVGSGEVWFVGVTGSVMEDWSQGHRFWGRVLHPRLDPAPGLHHGFADNATTFLASVVGVKAPRPLVVVLLLGIYVTLAVFVLVVCRWRNRAELAWPVLMGLALAGLAVAFTISQAARAEVGFVQGELGVTMLRPGMTRGATTSYVGLFSPEPTTADLRWVSPDTLATGYPHWAEGASGGLAESLQVRQSNRFIFPQVRLNPGEMQIFRAMTMSRFGKGAELTFGYGPDGVTGEIVNRTGHRLYDCILRVNRRTLRVGVLPDGGRKALADCELAWSLSASDFTPSDEAKMRRYILAELLRVRTRPGSFGSRRFYSWPVTFYGWCNSPLARLDVGDQKPQERAMQLLAMPVDEVDAASTVRVPAGACGLRLLKGGNRMAYGNPTTAPIVSDVHLPDKGIRIAGTKRRTSKRPERESESPRRADGLMRVARQKPKTAAERFRPTGWKPGRASTHIRVGFTRPQGLEALRVTRLVLHVDVMLRDFTGTVKIRKAGDETFVTLPDLTLGSGPLARVFEGESLERYLGPGGELPEFELRLRPPSGELMSAGGQWEIRVLDVELAGTLPPTETR